MIDVKLRTGVWYNEREFKLSFPDSWDIKTYWPKLPKSLTKDEIIEKLNAPIKSSPIKELLKGKSKPLIIIDDITRPTPIFSLINIIISQILEAGISANNIEILVATGTHGPSDSKALINKIGADIYNNYRVINHEDKKRTKFIGTTSFRTPIYINPRILKSDFLIGIGGIYPQYTTGFGGGSKLILGVLGRKTIRHLHYNHKSVDGNYNIDNSFRKDLSEIAKLVKFENLITVHTNERLEIVNIFSGNHFDYYSNAAAFSYNSYLTPKPNDADVIIANAFPSDVAYTFMRKGNFPLLIAPKGSFKLIIGSNHGGLGHHGLFPQGKSENYLKIKQIFDQLSTMRLKTIFSKIVKKLNSKLNGFSNKVSQNQFDNSNIKLANKSNDELIVYIPPGGNTNIEVRGTKFITNWDDVLTVINKKFVEKEKINVRIYPCSPIQCFKNN